MEVIIFDASGFYDVFTITEVQGSASHLQHRGQDMSTAYPTGASITQIESNTYLPDPVEHKLMRDDGGGNILPLVDNVVDLKFEYFGDINPPRTPDPGVGSGIANCLYDASHNYIAGMATLTPDEGGLASLTAAMLTDGPWCGGGTTRFDADLLRVRKVRVSYRVQAGNPALRAKDPGGVAIGSCNAAGYTGMFMCPGYARGGEKFVPDYRVVFDVSPRNLNLTR
jgi:hypothetical protein